MSDQARIVALERLLVRQRAVSTELEQMLEDKTRELFLALESSRAQGRLVGQQAAMRILLEEGSLEAAAPRMLQTFCTTLGWDIGSLWLRGEKERLVCVSTWHVPSPAIEGFVRRTAGTMFDVGVGLPGRAWELARPAWINDVLVDDNFPRQTAARDAQLHAACAFPVLVDGAAVAIIELLALEKRSSDDALLVTFEALGRQIGQYLETKRAREALRDQELSIAKRIQMSILPRELKVSGLEVAAAMIPASEVGGDYYDVIPFHGGAWLAIGDVSGHGLDAGLLMLMVQSAIAAAVRSLPEAPPSAILTCVNTVLYDNIRLRLQQNDHITLSLLKYSAADGKILASGAHEEVLVIREGTGLIETFLPPGTWLGARQAIGDVSEDVEFQLGVGDTLVLYTDGVIEGMSAERELFDFHRFTSCVADNRRSSASVLRDAVLERVARWSPRQQDDMTILVARRS